MHTTPTLPPPHPHIETQDLGDFALSNKGLEELSAQEVIGLLSYVDLDRFATEFKTERVSAILFQCRVWLVYL